VGGDAYLAAARVVQNSAITVHAVGNPAPLRTITLQIEGEIAPGGLVFVGPTTLLAVILPPRGSDGGTVKVQVFGHVTAKPRAATVKLTSTSTAVTGEGRVTLSAHVTGGATGTVRFFNGSALVGERRLSKGRASVTVAIHSTTSFTASYSGDDLYSPA